MPRSRRRGGKRKPAMAMPEQTEVDAFHENRDRVMLGGEDNPVSGDESGEDMVAVMDLNKFQDSSSDDESGDDSSDAGSGSGNGAGNAAGAEQLDSDSDVDDAFAREAQAVRAAANATGTAGWGSKRAEFFGGDTGDVSDMDEEDARDEEKEAQRLQRARAELLQDDDFDLGVTVGDAVDASSSKKDKKKKKKDKKRGKKHTKGGMTNMAALEVVEKVARNVSDMTEDEKLQIVISDSPELLGLLEEFKKYVKEINEQIKPVLQKVQDLQLPTTRGVSALQVKLHLLLCYVTNLAFYLLLKAEGRDVKDHPVLDQILRARTMLERLKPLDAKLQYQIGRLLRSGAQNDTSRPNASSLVPHGAEDGEDEQDGADNEAQRVYQPLKRTSVAFETRSSKEERRAARRLKRASKSKMLAELKEEMSEAPKEIRDRTSASAAADRREEEQRRFEEEHMVRLVVSKKERKLRRQQRREAQRLSTLADLDDFGDLEELMAGEEAAGAGSMPLKGALKRRAMQEAVNQVEQRHRSAVRKAVAISGDQTVRRREKRSVATLADQAEAEGHFGRGDAGFGGMDNTGAGGGHVSEDEAYEAALAQRVRKRARKQKNRDEVMEARRRAAASSMLPEDVGDDFDGKRKVNRAIMKNRGLVKYRKRDEANPRVHLRKKFEKKRKARRGQVREMREHQSNAYDGEASGIRTRLARSHKL